MNGDSEHFTNNESSQDFEQIIDLSLIENKIFQSTIDKSGEDDSCPPPPLIAFEDNSNICVEPGACSAEYQILTQPVLSMLILPKLNSAHVN